jgi:ubiquinone/menaquinone biosynthesis C-methylase UbiE
LPEWETPPASTFDAQAPSYDARAGLPATAAAAVARTIVACAGARAGDLVVELGAGTGEIGIHVLDLPVRYVGLDASAAMLEVFRARASGSRPALVVADGDEQWPLPDGCATVVIASRVIHLLRPDHVAWETMRTCRAGGTLILGRVARDRDAITERLRRQRLSVLQAAGIPARQGEEGTRRIIEAMRDRGGQSLGRQTVTEWSSLTTSGEIIADWETRSRWGAVDLDQPSRAAMVDELREWARREFADLDRPESVRSRYVIDVVRLPLSGTRET